MDIKEQDTVGGKNKKTTLAEKIVTTGYLSILSLSGLFLVYSLVEIPFYQLSKVKRVSRILTYLQENTFQDSFEFVGGDSTKYKFYQPSVYDYDNLTYINYLIMEVSKSEKSLTLEDKGADGSLLIERALGSPLGFSTDPKIAGQKGALDKESRRKVDSLYNVGLDLALKYLPASVDSVKESLAKARRAVKEELKRQENKKKSELEQRIKVF